MLPILAGRMTHVYNNSTTESTPRHATFVWSRKVHVPQSCHTYMAIRPRPLEDDLGAHSHARRAGGCMLAVKLHGGTGRTSAEALHESRVGHP